MRRDCFWTGWHSEVEEETEDARPGVHYITIWSADGEEIAVIIHRECGGRFPLDGDLAKAKELMASLMCECLNGPAIWHGDEL